MIEAIVSSLALSVGTVCSARSSPCRSHFFLNLHLSRTATFAALAALPLFCRRCRHGRFHLLFGESGYWPTAFKTCSDSKGAPCVCAAGLLASLSHVHDVSVLLRAHGRAGCAGLTQASAGKPRVAWALQSLTVLRRVLLPQLTPS